MEKSKLLKCKEKNEKKGNLMISANFVFINLNVKTLLN